MSKSKQTSTFKSVKIEKATLDQLVENFKEESQTFIHCNYVSKRKYLNGGWVNIHPTTYLVNGSKSLPLLHAFNIPLAPQIHLFSKIGELKQFTLVFPSIPKDWDSFSMIEQCNSDEGFVVTNIKRNNSGVYEVAIH